MYSNPDTGVNDPESHCVRRLLMAHLRGLMQSRHLTQVQAAAWFRVGQSRISHLVNNRVNRFTTDTLINMLGHAGVRVQIAFLTQEQPRSGSHPGRQHGLGSGFAPHAGNPELPARV